MRPRRRVIVVALDGLGIDLFRGALARGHIPHLAALAGPGGPRAIATRPPASPQAAWTTFTTASNPGRHGIFGLTHPGRQLRIRIASADHVRMPTLWDRAATDGLRSVVVGLPGTYPARRMSGSMVAGYVVPNPERLCYPRALSARVAEAGYRSDIDVRTAASDPERFAAELLTSVERRIEVMRQLLKHDRWSLAVLAFTELDRWGHAWRRRVAAGDHDALVVGDSILSSIDRFFGFLREAYGAAKFQVLSANGIAPVDHLLNLDGWLRDAGYLHREDGQLGGRTVAFSMEAGRIYIHATRMFADGRLGGGSVLPLMDEIAEGLTALRSPDGALPLQAVVRRRDLYDGPHARVGPHLVAVPAPGWAVVSSRKLPLVSKAADFEGGHRHDLAFAVGDAADDGSPVTLEDLGATVLADLAVYDDDVDGTALRAGGAKAQRNSR
ncbi:MAG: alkaline phosphatase family protein [Chloroflexota bacterium]